MKYIMLAPFALLFFFGAVLALGLVPPNSYVGFRSGQTLSNADLWYSVNTNVGWSLVIASVIGAAFVWRIFSTDLHITVKSLASTAALVMLAVVTVVVGVSS